MTNITLYIMIQEEWNVISLEELASIVSSMPEHIEAVHTY